MVAILSRPQCVNTWVSQGAPVECRTLSHFTPADIAVSHGSTALIGAVIQDNGSVNRPKWDYILDTNPSYNQVPL